VHALNILAMLSKKSPEKHELLRFNREHDLCEVLLTIILSELKAQFAVYILRITGVFYIVLFHYFFAEIRKDD